MPSSMVCSSVLPSAVVISTAVAPETELVQLVLGQAVLLGHHFGAHELAELDVGIALFHPRALRHAEALLGGQADRQAHGHAAHALDAGGDHHVHGARHHRLGGEVQGLLRGAALAVHRRPGHAFRQLRSQDGVARHIGGLLADLHDAAHDHIVDQGRIGARAIDQAVDDLAGEVGRMDAGETASLAPASGARGGDDIGFGHGGPP
jgi:hypothetical protein